MDTTTPNVSFTPDPVNLITTGEQRGDIRSITTTSEHSFMIASGPVFSVAGGVNSESIILL